MLLTSLAKNMIACGQIWRNSLYIGNLELRQRTINVNNLYAVAHIHTF